MYYPKKRARVYNAFVVRMDELHVRPKDALAFNKTDTDTESIQTR